MKKIHKVIILIAATMMIFACGYFVNANDEIFSGGDGSEGNPYQITNVDQLNLIRDFLDSSFILKNDIEFNNEDFKVGGKFYNDGKCWIPIGQGYSVHDVRNEDEYNELKEKYQTLFVYKSGLYTAVNQYDDFYDKYYHYECFSGNFNGNGHEIINLKIKTEGQSYSDSVGLFGISNGIIEKLGIINCNIDVKGKARCGAICGSGKEIRECYSDGRISLTSGGYIGGIAGNCSNIYQCYNTARIEGGGSDGSLNAGGIVGIGATNDCFNTGYVSAGSECEAGGIAGLVAADKCIDYCYNIGDCKSAFSGYTLTMDPTVRHSYVLDTYEFSEKYTQAKKCSWDELKAKATFEWLDFDNTWQIGVNDNYHFPELQGIENIITDIDRCEVSLNTDSINKYDSYPVVTVKKESTVYEYGKDYYLLIDGEKPWNLFYLVSDENGEHYEPNIYLGDAGDKTIEVIGIGRLTGKIDLSFQVKPYDISNADLYGPDTHLDGGAYQRNRFIPQDYSYDGTEKTQSGFTVEVYGNRLRESDYSIAYRNNINPGTADMIIEGKAPNYTGQKIVHFNISNCEHTYSAWVLVKQATFNNIGSRKHMCSKCGMEEYEEIEIPKVSLSKSAYTYNGKVQRPALNVSGLSDNKYYTVKWSGGCKNVGTHTATVTLKGEKYSGSTKLSYVINPKGTSVKKLSKSKKAFTVKWSKQSTKMSTSRITGYQIQYSTSSKFASGNKTVKVKGYSKTSKKISKLKAKKKYYVRVRTYKTVSGTTYYSGWSKSKSITTK